MKKLLQLLLILVFLTAAFIAAPVPVNACEGEPTGEEEEEGWELGSGDVTAEEIKMYEITSTPKPWLTLMANAVKIDGATQICHEFNAGRYGMTGIIYKLVNGKWVKLSTTNGWYPTVEGDYLACAKAKSAGIYALFGY